MSKQYNKTTILFGAGAVLSWGAPSTCCLTNLILDSGFYMSNNTTRITRFIYDTLINDNGYAPESVNFETIINVIEELIIYYSYFNADNKTTSLHQSFFNSKFENEILNFAVYEQDSYGFKLEIPKGKRSEYANKAENNITPEQHFFQSLLSELLTSIQIKIEGYALHNKGISNVLTDTNKEINTLFEKWVYKAIGNGNLRMYTLNYDRIFKVILENAENSLSIFEGFDCGKKIDYSARIPPNISKILSDTDSHVLYNLHGSAFWHVEPEDENKFRNPKFYLRANVNLNINQRSAPIYQSEVGKTMMLTNIITGYQKIQKSILTPFKQMQAAFDRDCCFSDTVYIIGYSFNDEHINAGIRAAIQSDNPIKFVIVDPGFKKNNFDVNVVIKIFSNAGQITFPKNLTNDIHSFYNGKFIVYAMKFAEFMEYKLSQRFENDF